MTAPTANTLQVTFLESPMRVTNYTCADGTGIKKGVVMTLSDPFTAAEVSGTHSANIGYAFAGICWADKEASDGSTQVAVASGMKIDAYASGAITAGRGVKSIGGGFFSEIVSADTASHSVVGKALETAATGEQINIFIYPQ